MSKTRTPYRATSLALRALTVALVLGATGASSAGAQCDGACQDDLVAARQGTALYHDESMALADGYAPDPICIGLPGIGAMGIHYFNAALAGDIQVVASAPEILMFEPMSDGSRRLVGVEYFAPVLSNGAPWFGAADNPPPVVDNPAPTLFGMPLQGPMPGHNPFMPWHYDLHVWAWRHNPTGLFSPLNPKVACD